MSKVIELLPILCISVGVGDNEWCISKESSVFHLNFKEHQLIVIVGCDSLYVDEHLQWRFQVSLLLFSTIQSGCDKVELKNHLEWPVKMDQISNFSQRPQSIFYIFMQFSAKIMSNNRLAPPSVVGAPSRKFWIHHCYWTLFRGQKSENKFVALSVKTKTPT